MIYEIRTYTLKPGQTPEYEKRFEASLPARLKYSELAAFWHTEIGPLNQVIHVWPYEDLQQRAEIRARAAKEPDWPPKTGDLLLSMESGIYVPAPSSPKLGGGQKLGNIYEMRIYQCQPGSIPTVISQLQTVGLTPLSLTLTQPTLDDVFLQVTGSRLIASEAAKSKSSRSQRREEVN